MKLNQVRTVAASLAKHSFFLCCLLFVGLLLSACTKQASVAAGGDITGVYTLASVDGKKVPGNISHEGTPLQVRSGIFTINADGTCSTKTTFVPPSGAEATRDT